MDWLCSINIKKYSMLIISLITINFMTNCRASNNNNEENNEDINKKTPYNMYNISNIEKIKSSSSKNIQDIPAVILSKIFIYVDWKNIFSVICTNKSWKLVMEDNKIWYKHFKKIVLFDNPNSAFQFKNYKQILKTNFVPSFTDLGTLKQKANSYAIAKDISNDGTVIAGLSDGFIYMWTQETGIKKLNGIFHKNSAYKLLSDDSMVVVEESGKIMKWTSEKEFATQIDALLDKVDVEEISSNGRTIIGTINNSSSQKNWEELKSVIWTKKKGLRLLNTNEKYSKNNYTCNLNNDGSIIVGAYERYVNGHMDADAPPLMQRAFEWTEETGIRKLNGLENTWNSCAHKIRGEYIVGEVQKRRNDPAKAFLYSKNKGLQYLETLTGYTDCVAHDVNADGTVVVGRIFNNESMFKDSRKDRPDAYWEAFIWTAEKGMQTVEKLLLKNNITIPSDWKLIAATAISPNGFVELGVAIVNDKPRAWRAVIPGKNL